MNYRTVTGAFGATLAAACLLTASAAVAEESPMQGAFGNTIVSTYPDGAKGRAYLEPDGTYRAVTREGWDVTGRWTIERKRLCYHGDAAPGAPPLCTIGLGKKVGDSWNIFLEDGSKIRVELVAGR
jgi:hypothetical protein